MAAPLIPFLMAAMRGGAARVAGSAAVRGGGSGIAKEGAKKGAQEAAKVAKPAAAPPAAAQPAAPPKVAKPAAAQPAAAQPAAAQPAAAQPAAPPKVAQPAAAQPRASEYFMEPPPKVAPRQPARRTWPLQKGQSPNAPSQATKPVQKSLYPEQQIPESPIFPKTPGGKPGGKPGAPKGSPREKGFAEKLYNQYKNIRDKLGSPSRVDQAAERTDEARASLSSKPRIDYGDVFSNMGQSGAMDDAKSKAAKASESMKDELNQAIEDETDERKKLIPQLKDTYTKVAPFTKVFGKVTGTALALSVVFATLPFAIRKWTDYLEQSRRQLELYNGRIAAAFVKLDIQKFQHKIKTGSETAGTTANLADAIYDFREAFRPINSTLINLTNVVSTGVLKVTTTMAEILSVIAWFRWGDADKEILPQQVLGGALFGARDEPGWKNPPRDPLAPIPPLKGP